jgi:hypothetical protein
VSYTSRTTRQPWCRTLKIRVRKLRTYLSYHNRIRRRRTRPLNSPYTNNLNIRIITRRIGRIIIIIIIIAGCITDSVVTPLIIPARSFKVSWYTTTLWKRTKAWPSSTSLTRRILYDSTRLYKNGINVRRPVGCYLL